MSRKNLESKNCKELREMAAKLNIVGRWEMKKDQLIEAILGANSVKENMKEDMANEDLQSAKDEVKIDNQKGVEVEDKIENESANPVVNMEQKMAYIENVDIGTIVAFRLSNGRVKSAKVTRKSTKDRRLKLETDYGVEYIVPYESIVWVRTGKRWPRGVYKLLKGQVDINGKERIKA